MGKNIQISLETMLRCGGNCSGCALSSLERMSKSSIDWGFLKEKVSSVHGFLKEKSLTTEIESIGLFLGQGDHFLMSEDEMHKYMEYCSKMIPKELMHKTVTFITASAIGKEKNIKEKMDKFFEISLLYKMPFFIQVVFDPKKMSLTDKFKSTYINNIMYFKSKCGMTEVTLNLGNDMLTMTPKEFHQWVLEYGFTHVEMNWVMNNQTSSMWEKYSESMFSWLKELLIIYASDHKYEINFIPFLARAFALKGIDNANLIKEIGNSLEENIYIDSIGNVSLAQSGLVSNLTPLLQRLEKQNLTTKNINEINIFSNKSSKNIMSKLLRKKFCVDCDFNYVCAQIGSTAWFDFEKQNGNNCPWNIKDFLSFISDYLVTFPNLGKTKFDKNPIQDSVLSVKNNETFHYFEKKFKKIDNT